LNETVLSTFKQCQFVDSVIFGQVNSAVFRALSKYFSGKDGSASFKKLARRPGPNRLWTSLLHRT